MHPRLRNLLLATTPLLALGLTQASAGPEGASVVGGAATISGQGGPAVIVNQSTSSAVINWNTFNIRANESVRFNQPNSSSVALNRVVGGLGPSEIMGSLTANGRVFIINRDGILFGPGSVVNTAGFLATTNDIKNADFMAGRYNFNIPGRPEGKRSLYSGTEPATTKPVDERQQAASYDLGLRLAFCQPTVEGILLFHSQDETALPSWQSGVYYADGTPKSSFWAVRDSLARTRGGSIARCDGMALEVSPLGVRFPGPRAFQRGVHSVRFRCSLDCAWTLEALRSTTGALAARVNGYGRGDTTLIASFGKTKLGKAPVRLRLTLVHPVNPGAPESVTSGLLRPA